MTRKALAHLGVRAPSSSEDPRATMPGDTPGAKVASRAIKAMMEQ